MPEYNEQIVKVNKVKPSKKTTQKAMKKRVKAPYLLVKSGLAVCSQVVKVC